MNGCITTTKQSTTKPCAYFLGYTVWSVFCGFSIWLIFCLSSCNYCKKEMSQLGARLTLTFDLEFSMLNCISRMELQGQIWNLLYRSHETESKHIDWTLGLKWDHRVWAWIFKVKYGICYISAKWSDCQEKKKKHIDWTPCLKCDHDQERWCVRI